MSAEAPVAAHNNGDNPGLRPTLRRYGRPLVAASLVALSLLWLLASADFGPNSVAQVLPVLTMAGVYAVAAMGLNIQYTLGGLLNFGYVGFMAIGAYVTVLLIPNRVGQGSVPSEGVLPLWAAAVVAVLVTGLVGALFALPTMRVRGDYFAMIMIASAELIRVLLKELPMFTGGPFGVLGYTNAIHDLRPQVVDSLAEAVGATAYQAWLFLLAWSVVLILAVVTALLLQTRWALLARAVKDDELAVRSLGKNPTTVKLQSLVLGGCVGGLAGVLLAFQLSQVNPDIFVADITFFVFTVLIIGGPGTALGPIVGGIVFWALYTQAGVLISDLFGSSTMAASARYILVGVVLTLLFVFRPQGVLGSRADALKKL